ncbi:hypothetical protein JYU34_016300 [Plutella xylostella]|uniref:Uncharacterized protein n=1 Tax=Plutella xylostella TaxID=51655 RepID=A0ABQ7Q2A9_PLUXY|nr:hypothetical protein JYU34_016300 [Plutella xylostella]
MLLRSWKLCRSSAKPKQPSLRGASAATRPRLDSEPADNCCGCGGTTCAGCGPTRGRPRTRWRCSLISS